MKRLLMIAAVVVVVAMGKRFMHAPPSSQAVISGEVPTVHADKPAIKQMSRNAAQVETQPSRHERFKEQPDRYVIARNGIYVFTCKNDKTGVTTFSSSPCAVNADQIKVGQANVLDSSEWRHRVAQQQFEREQVAQAREQRQRAQPSTTNEESNYDRQTRIRNCMVSARSEKEKLLCQGVMPMPADNYADHSYAAPSPPPKVITNCDDAGCWDNQGGRYNHGVGTTYFSPSGGACQMIGGQMECH